MTCVEFEECIQRMLDGPSSADTAPVAEHIASCPPCSQLYAAARRLQEGLGLQCAPRVPHDFATQTVAAIVAERIQRQRRRWYATIALAASLLLAVLAGYRWFHDSQPNALPSSPIADSDTVLPKESASTSSPRERVAGAGEAVASLSRKATEETVEQTRLLWPVATAPISFDGIDLQTPLEPPAQSLREAGQGVSAGLEPVANSARRAMNLFWRDLPPAEPGKKHRS